MKEEGQGDAQAPGTGCRVLKVDGHVGFDSLPDQLVATNAVQKGYVFNLLCVGETGIGKSTLVDSLFNTDSQDYDGDYLSPGASANGSSSAQLTERRHTLSERGVQLNLTVVESVGYGDQLNKEESYKAIENYVDEQFEAYFKEELKIERCLPMYHDTRIHACLYFICPTGNGLKAIDILCMKKLHEKVNIIPVIGKADAMSRTELKKFKGEIMSELMANKVKIYEFPVEDDCSGTGSKSIGVDLPFAVVGSREFVRAGSKTVRGRGYPWGNVLVENEAHCDFVKLREMLIRTHMEDLKEQTHECHYEKYRRDRLTQIGFHDDGGSSFQEMCQQKLHVQFDELAEIEKDLKKRMTTKIRIKEEELKEAERLLREKYEQIAEDQLNENETLGGFSKQLESEMAMFRSLTEQYLSQQPQKKPASTSAFSLGSLGRTKKSY